MLQWKPHKPMETKEDEDYCICGHRLVDHYWKCDICHSVGNVQPRDLCRYNHGAIGHFADQNVKEKEE